MLIILALIVNNNFNEVDGSNMVMMMVMMVMMLNGNVLTLETKVFLPVVGFVNREVCNYSLIWC